MNRPALQPGRQDVLCAVALALIFLCAPFPRLQAIFHVMLVLALAPRPGAALRTALWAAAGGWAVEGAARLFPHLGGTPWADMTVALLAAWMAGRWPLETRRGWVLRLTALALLHTLLVHGAVRLAAGPHPWGSGWAWALVTLPAWSWFLGRLLLADVSPRRL
ncbi:MAG TPA: hypothetical protein VF768_00880 [Holophagaceae bacterium]